MIEQVTQQPRQFSPPIQATDFPTKLLRLEFECSSLSYYTEIDAVCLLGTLDPISPSARATAMLPPPSQLSSAPHFLRHLKNLPLQSADP